MKDIQTGKNRGYAFIEFASERDMKDAYKYSNNMYIDGRHLTVDFEKGRTVEGWIPRRFGGGVGKSRVEPTIDSLSSSSSSSSSSSHGGRDRDRDRDRNRDRDRGRRGGDRGGGDRYRDDDRNGGGRDRRYSGRDRKSSRYEPY